MSSFNEIIWLGDTLKVLRSFPEAIKDDVGYALHQVEEGRIPRNSKVLTGIKPQVVEIISSHNKDTYRTIYTVKLSKAIYVLHCFQKKSKRGIQTPKQEIELIKQRLQDAKIIENE